MLRSAALLFLIATAAAATAPQSWVPVRWNSTDPKTLALLDKTPVNCLLLNWRPEASKELANFAAEATKRNVTTLAVIVPGTDPVASARAALAAKLTGIVLEGDFPAAVRDTLSGAAPIVELTSRASMKLGTRDPVLGTYQGVWAGVQPTDAGAAKAGPSGSAWIDTNSGFLRAVRAWGDNTIWIANRPPANTVVTTERYLQAVGDAAMVGARWVVALDDDLSTRLYKSDPNAVKAWTRIAELLQYFESHADWRTLRPGGKLAIVQATKEGGLLSGGILDMIATKHTPLQAVPPQRLTAETLKGATMAVDIDSNALTPEQKEVLKQFTRSGGTVLTGPPGWTDAAPADKSRITLDDKELKRIDDMWHDMQAMIGRKNLGVRLFNVSSMLSNLLTTEDRKQVYVQLVNYSEYPVDNVTMHVLGDYTKARLYTPDGKERDVEVYKNDEGTGVDLDNVGVCATVRLQ